MKAIELRLGNFIYKESEYEFENGINQIISVLEFECVSTRPLNCHVKHHNVNISNLKPIPLTEEWLLKFGFSREVKVGSEMGTDGVEFRVYHFDVLTFNTNHGWWYKVQRINDTPLEYVHQLQNLYFALKGEELTLKP